MDLALWQAAAQDRGLVMLLWLSEVVVLLLWWW
jgi:hypothetical protein